MFVYHVDNETIHDLIDGVLFSVPPCEPYEIPSDFIGQAFIRHKYMHGVVELRTQKTRQGIQFLLDEAHLEATAKLLEAEKEVIDNYLSSQMEDRLRNGKPAMPPGGRQKILIAKHDVDLASYGIRPVGSAAQLSPEIAAMIRQNQQMMDLIKLLLVEKGIAPASSIGAGVAQLPANQTPKGFRSPEERAADSYADDGVEVTKEKVEYVPPTSAPQNPNVGRAPEIPVNPNPTAEDFGDLVGKKPEEDDPNAVTSNATVTAAPIRRARR